MNARDFIEQKDKNCGQDWSNNDQELAMAFEAYAFLKADEIKVGKTSIMLSDRIADQKYKKETSKYTKTLDGIPTECPFCKSSLSVMEMLDRKCCSCGRYFQAKLADIEKKPVFCPVCGTNCIVEGDDGEGTHYYVPVKQEQDISLTVKLITEDVLSFLGSRVGLMRRDCDAIRDDLVRIVYGKLNRR